MHTVILNTFEGGKISKLTDRDRDLSILERYTAKIKKASELANIKESLD